MSVSALIIAGMGFFRDAIRVLNEADVRYVVVGGVAVVLQGHVRNTVDLDLVIDLTPDEALKAVEALVGLGLVPNPPVDPRDFADPVIRASWIEQKNMLVFQFRDPNDTFARVDLFVSYPIEFDELWEDSVMLPLEGMEVRTASIPHLLEMKRAAARPLDLTDVEALEVILEERNRGRS